MYFWPGFDWPPGQNHDQMKYWLGSFSLEHFVSGQVGLTRIFLWIFLLGTVFDNLPLAQPTRLPMVSEPIHHEPCCTLVYRGHCPLVHEAKPLKSVKTGLYFATSASSSCNTSEFGRQRIINAQKREWPTFVSPRLQGASRSRSPPQRYGRICYYKPLFGHTFTHLIIFVFHSAYFALSTVFSAST